MGKYSELAEWLDACRSGSVPDAKAHEAAFAIRRLEARVAELERAALAKKDGIRILLKDGESIGSFQEYLEAIAIAIAKAEGK